MRLRKNQLYWLLLPLDNFKKKYQIIQVAYVECIMNKKYDSVILIEMVENNPYGHKKGDEILVGREDLFHIKDKQSAINKLNEIIGA